METLIERLKKIEALARAGTAGERENAQRLLTALCKKYGVTLQQLTETEKDFYKFTFKGVFERRLFIQVLVFVMQSTDILHRKTARGFAIELTLAQSIDVRECWQHYRKIWLTQANDFMSAFIHKNGIWGPSSGEDKKSTEESMAAALRVMELMRGIRSHPWEKRLKLTT